MNKTTFDLTALSFEKIVERALKNAKNSLAQKFLTDDDVLAILHEGALEQVVDFRKTARMIGARMRALADPKTAALEPLERLQAHRVKMVAMAADLFKLQGMMKEEALTADEGGKVKPSAELVELAGKFKLSVQEEVTATWLNQKAKAFERQVSQASIEIKGLDDGELGMMVETYDVLVESYQIALGNLQQAEDVLKQVEVKAPTMMLVVKTFREAQDLADVARGQTTDDKGVNAFMSKLKKQMTESRGEFRADQQIDADLDSRRTPTFEDTMAQYDSPAADMSIMAEIEAAAA